MAKIQTSNYGKPHSGIVGYVYGMRLRGFSPGAQPKGVTWFDDDVSNYEYRTKGRRYHTIIGYDRQLFEQELKDYELDFLGTGLPSDWII